MNADPSIRRVSSWGRLSNELHSLVPLHDRTALAVALTDSTAQGLAYGNGRSYGDVCLNPGGNLWTTRGLDRFVSFDTASGVIDCEAGVLLKEVIALGLPHGWFPPVTPGTQFVTVGGAIANDVHGKNHHSAGTLGEHVQSLLLRRTDGALIECGPGEHRDWLEATIIYSTLPTGSKRNPASGYGSYSGTSMATPHVSGAAALYKSIRERPLPKSRPRSSALLSQPHRSTARSSRTAGST